MFLTKDNHMKWCAVLWGALITMMLVFAGIFVFDVPLFLLLRKLNCGAWGVLDVVFAGKVWIVVSGIAVLVFCANKCAKTDCKFLSVKKSLFAFVRDFFDNIRTNNAFLIFCSVLGAGIVVKILKTCIGRVRPIFVEA